MEIILHFDCVNPHTYFTLDSVPLTEAVDSVPGAVKDVIGLAGSNVCSYSISTVILDILDYLHIGP